LLFLPYSGGVFTLDDYNDFGDGDEVYVEGTPGTIGYPCPWCGTYQYPCLYDVTIVPCQWSTGCCQGRVGDCNNSGDDEPSIGDLAVLIDFLFISKDPAIIACVLECDLNQSGGCDATVDDLTIGDISRQIDLLFICLPPGPCERLPCLLCPGPGR
jgi:hypothetical protein